VRHQDPADVVERAFANARALLLIG
jgi:hypothetical protein